MSGKKSKKSQKKQQSFQDKLWRGRDGNPAVFLRPNWLLTSWFVFSLAYWLNLITPLNRAFFGIATVLLAVWAAQELWQGASYFRRTLGFVVLFLVAVSLPRIWYIVF